MFTSVFQILNSSYELSILAIIFLLQVFQYVMEITTMMAASSHHSEQAMKIFLYAAQVEFPKKRNS